MSDNIISAAGERAAMGGYVPQFNEFARFAYQELVRNNLEWIKIADPEAEKLDDIQYATQHEVHAYQVKWTIADQTISYLNFTTLLPLILSSWQKLSAIHIKDKKKVIAHLLTNKALSNHDRIMSGKKEVGTFADFYTEVWQKWKLDQPVAKKWNTVIKKMKSDLKLTDADFQAFILQLEFHPEHVGVDLKVNSRLHLAEADDLLNFRSFLLEKVADPARVVPFSKQEIIDGLVWGTKFKTTFNHELSVDINRYQTITTTVEDLNNKLTAYNNGYIFLAGGPGSGKSTLLTEWMKTRTERILKYYAFDFTNPSFSVNYQERGDATNLYFDLVFQLKDVGIYSKSVLPYKDLVFLKSVFAEQLEELGQEYIDHNRKTIIIIDGLDHVPREYKSVKQSFLRDLPLPTDLPEGVFIVLGSQSYEQEDLSQEIKAEWKSGTRSVQMSTMGKKEVSKYAETSEIEPTLTIDQQNLLFEKSQGHPLYLSYIVERLKSSDNRDETLNGSITIDGDIQVYYNKIWEPISSNAGLIDMLGLMARINDSIAISFVTEWNLPNQSLLDFKRYARALFDESLNEWTFFHNSFRLFLLSETAANPLTGKFDSSKDIAYHRRIATFYNNSTLEPGWKQNYHLFASGAFDQFILVTSPEEFFSQLINFRPPSEIRSDIKLGIEIAQKEGNVNTLLRYLFSLAELDRRTFNVDPASYIEELLLLDKIAEAKHYARNGATLLITQHHALEVARLFYEFGERAEGMLLYSLAQPDMVMRDSILLDYHKNIDNSTYQLLQEWVTSGALFQNHEILLQKIKNLKAINIPNEREVIIKPELIRNLLLRDLAIALMNQEKWLEMEQVLTKYDLKIKNQKKYFFQVLRYAISANIEQDRDLARKHLKLLLANFSPANSSVRQRINTANLIITLEKDNELAIEWIEGVVQPVIRTSKELGVETSFSLFSPLIELNKLLNLTGKGVSIMTAVPKGLHSSNEQALGEFQRMLCLITQLLCEGIENNTITNLDKRIQPIIQFYNRDVPANNTYWYQLTRVKTDYFDFLIKAIARSGQESIKKLVTALEVDIAQHAKYWSSEQIREIANSLLRMDMEVEWSLALLSTLESNMLIDKDIDGRVTECIRQTKSYLLSNDKEQAEKWLKRSIEESIGVGNRKDYQFNTWLDWLVKNIRRYPKTAAQDICWFLSHLHHLKETTEGRAADMAASKLLGITLDWNPAVGVVQMKWLLDNALIEFDDAIGTFIKIFLAKDIGKQEYELLAGIFEDLHLFFTTYTDVSLLKLFFQKGDELYGEAFYDTWVSTIHQMFRTKALDEQRPEMFIALEEFLLSRGKDIYELVPDFVIPEEPDHRRRSRSSSSSNTLVIGPDHKGISHREIMDSVNTYEELRDLLQKEDKANSWYDWTEIFQKIKPLINLAQIREIGAIIPRSRKQIELLVLLSERAYELGDKVLAEQLVDESIAQSSSSGWVTFYDGGSRIKAFTALRKIKGAEGIKKAFDMFCNDLLHRGSAGGYVESLDEILPVITSDYDEDTLWSQLLSYLQRLMSTSTPSDNLPDLTPQDKGIYDNIIDVLIYFSAYPVTLVNTAAQRLLAGELDGKAQYPIKVATELQLNDDTNAELFMGLMLLSQEHGNDLSTYYPKLKALATSPNYMIRCEAVQLLKLNSQTVPKIAKQTLSPFYEIDLDSSNFDSSTLNISGDLHPLGQIIKLISPLDWDLKILSRMTGFTEKALMYRTYMMLRQTDIIDNLLIEDEDGFRNHLEQIRLKYAYPKPRVVAVKRGILRVVSELVDAGVLDNEAAFHFFCPRDKAPDLWTVSVRPKFINRLGEREFILDSKNWLDNIEDNPRLKESILRYQDERNVIGEYTILTSLFWGKAQQIFMSQVKGDTKSNKGWYIFGKVINRQTKNYHDLQRTGNSLIIVREETRGSFSTLSNWIAINPVLARHLGWHPLPGKLFAWADEEGNCLVESVYWMDGNIHMRPPHLYSEAGEGWYILATDQAIAEIKMVEPNLYQEKFIYRSTEYDSSSEKHSTIIKLD